jgi:hypothetical protein
VAVAAQRAAASRPTPAFCWRTVVRECVAGKADATAVSVSGSSRTHLTAVLNALTPLAGQQAVNDELLRGAMLHTDIAMRISHANGGSLFEVESTRDVRAVFGRILEEFRHRYIVSFVPRGVARAGWHTLDVRIKDRKAVVKARPGYLAGS